MGEKYGLDLEAWGLKDKANVFLEDYKTIGSQVRSGDEIWMTLKHKALHDQKNYSCTVHVVAKDGGVETFSCAVDPFITVGEFLKFVSGRMPKCSLQHAIFLPIIKQSGAVAGVWLDNSRTFASYGMADNMWVTGVGLKPKPLLLGERAHVLKMKHEPGVREHDYRVLAWLEILAAQAQTGKDLRQLKQFDLNKALV